MRQRAFFGYPLILGAITFGSAMSRGAEASGGEFVRGDPDADGERSITDAVYLLGCHFLGQECPGCADAADVNDDGLSDITDPVYLLTFLFLGGPEVPAPSAECGPDPSEDDLDCDSFPRCVPADTDTLPTARGDLVVVPIDHASLAIRWDGKTIFVDPVGGAALYQGLPAPDLILVTHTHGDHLNAPTIRAVAKAGTVLVVPQAVSTAIAGAGGDGNAEQRILANGEKATVGDIEVEAVPMYNLTSDRLGYHAKGVGNGYVIDLGGTRAYFSGDTEDIPEMRALPNISLAFLCMNLPFTMTPEQAASAVLEFKPRVVYPYHYRGQDPQKFKTLVEAGAEEIQVRIRNWY